MPCLLRAQGAQRLFLGNHCQLIFNYLSDCRLLELWKGSAHPSWAGARPVGEQCPPPSLFCLSLGWNASPQTGEECAPANQQGERVWCLVCASVGGRAGMIQDTDLFLNS